MKGSFFYKTKTLYLISINELNGELAKSPLWLHFKITSIWTFLESDKKSTHFYWESYRMKSQEALLCLIQFWTFSFEQFKPWTSVLFGTFYLWRVSSDLIMTAVRSKRTFIEYRLFEQYKFSIDSITNKTFWISKLFSEIICNENFIPVTLLLHPQAVCLGNNVFNKPHDMQRELSHIKSSLIMSNHSKLMSYDLLPPITDFIS